MFLARRVLERSRDDATCYHAVCAASLFRLSKGPSERFEGGGGVDLMFSSRFRAFSVSVSVSVSVLFFCFVPFFAGLRGRDSGGIGYHGGGASRRVGGGLTKVPIQEEDPRYLLQHVRVTVNAVEAPPDGPCGRFHFCALTRP